ncbi:uncharacterized protein A1O5_12020 [Cladophialophora psammophila CBS 110553]|uniref:Short-chain dehydrogenase/reductase family protein n=1 Tax=Cladophialophora psammophila CBS 110553 TaxID=1182543 RepID=W9VZV3_9EURO|nr:uncharacterized protein A1O5_12020 [Cladophialophora psammophila CBS 110553]EXJ61228.1 hypothetical protein A1O5_12020 [Cladophialophora psammophila CBS 110553]
MASSKDLPPSTKSYMKLFFESQFRTKPQQLPRGTNLCDRGMFSETNLISCSRRQLLRLPYKDQLADMASGSTSVAIVTGSNVGLGYEAARQLLSFNLSSLILAVRSVQNGELAATKLSKQYPKASIRVWSLDMASYQSIEAFAKRAGSDLARLDLVILNAGVGNVKFEVNNSTGHEEMMQVNYLSTMFLAILLLPVLKQRAPPNVPGRLSIVSSGLAFLAKIPEKNQAILTSLDKPDKFDPMTNYSVSKLLSHMFIYQLQDWVSAEDVVVNLVDPGYVKGTKLQRQVTGIGGAILWLLGAATARRVEHGASTYLDATISKGKESHRCYLADWRIQPFAPLLYTPHGKQLIEQVWRETLDEFDFVNARGILNSIASKE